MSTGDWRKKKKKATQVPETWREELVFPSARRLFLELRGHTQQGPGTSPPLGRQVEARAGRSRVRERTHRVVILKHLVAQKSYKLDKNINKHIS